MTSLHHLATRIAISAVALLASMASPSTGRAQVDTTRGHPPAQPDTLRRLNAVTITGNRLVHGATQPAPATAGGIIFSGKTAEVLYVDSTGSNLARDVTRQVYGQIPGANVSETEAQGFPGNGLGFRGLNPSQSLEMNVRQDGVNVAADLYGYNETYYSPPAEAVRTVTLVRGASSLAYGPQFGGAIDYVLRSGTPRSPVTVDAQQSIGSYGLSDTFASLGGGTGLFTYYGLFQRRSESGWRPNSDYNQTDGFARVDYQASSATRLSLEYTRFRNRIQMPGGLTDAEFDVDPRASFRTRNWLASPWSIGELRLDSRLSEQVHLYVTTSVMASQRYLVWRSEQGGAQLPDSIDPLTNAYAPREVDRESFTNVTNEARLQVDDSLLGHPNTLTTGLRVFGGLMGRDVGGLGTTGTGFDMTLVEPYATTLHFGTTNIAAFAEDLVHLSDRWSVTPGVRAEWLRSTVHGVELSNVDIASQAKTRTFALVGIGTEYRVARAVVLYANWSQAYRPVTYDALTPFGGTSRISPDLQDGRGYDVDVGVRATPITGLETTLAGYYMVYDHREGLYSGIDTSVGSTYTEIATIGNSVAKGVEASVTVAPFTAMGITGPLSGLTIFDAGAYDDAHYVSGVFSGNRVEGAPLWINRVGASYAVGPLSTTLQAATQTRSFTDANNTVLSPDDAGVGEIPGYTVLDWSLALTFARRYQFSLGVNNIGNARYFTDRTTEYPGPGIIPSPGRSFTIGVAYAPGR